MAAMASEPSLVEFGGLKFLLMEAPKDSNLHVFLKLFKKFNVTQIVRISEPRYRKETVEEAGIKVHEMEFTDGASPPAEIIAKFLDLVESNFSGPPTSASASASASADIPCIGVHCVAGLGRAPVLVAIALIEAGLDAVSAVTFIRDRRRGAINQVQLKYLESYVPKGRFKKKGGNGKCVVC